MSDRADYLLSLVLSEDRMPAMQAKWADKLNTSHDTRLTLSNDQHVRAKAALSHIERMDPTPNKQYTGKLIDWYHKGQFRAEDAGRVSTAVSQAENAASAARNFAALASMPHSAPAS